MARGRLERGQRTGLEREHRVGLPTVANPGPRGIDSVALRSDGKRFLTGDAVGQANEWSASTGRVTAAFVDPAGRGLSTVEYDSAVSGVALTASAYGDVCIWYLPQSRRFPGIPCSTPAELSGAALDDKGGRFVTSTWSGRIRLWAVRSGRPLGRAIQEPDRANVVDAAFDSSGTHVITASYDGTARVWDLSTGKQTGRTLIEPGDAYVKRAEFAPTGNRVLTTASDGARIWNWQTGRQQLTLAGNAGSVADAVFSPTGADVATADGNGTVRIWDAQPSQQVGPGIFGKDGSDLTSAFFNHQGTRIVTASASGTAQIWGVADQRRSLLNLREPGGASITSAVFDPTGTHVLTASNDGTVRIWNASTGQMLRSFPRPAGGKSSPTRPTAPTAAVFWLRLKLPTRARRSRRCTTPAPASSSAKIFSIRATTSCPGLSSAPTGVRS